MCASQKINKEDASMWDTGKRTPMDHQVAKEQETKRERLRGKDSNWINVTSGQYWDHCCS